MVSFTTNTVSDLRLPQTRLASVEWKPVKCWIPLPQLGYAPIHFDLLLTLGANFNKHMQFSGRLQLCGNGYISGLELFFC